MFDNYISLGWFCGVAASMSRYGFRNMSGVFDWINTGSLSGVIQLIDTDFADFLDRANLFEYQKAGQKIFFDKKYKMHFPHEISNNLEIDYLSIKQKYNYRIKRFRKMAQEKTCFLRAVKDYDEILYIQQNYEYITEVLTRSNRFNQVIFLIPKELTVDFEIEKICFYELGIQNYLMETREQLRNLFETNKEFILFCESNMDESKRKNNVIFDLKKEIEELKQENKRIRAREADISERRYQLLLKLEKTDFGLLKLPPKMIIYGAGNIGRLFYEKVNKYCEIIYFIDIQPKSSFICNVPVLSMESLDDIEVSYCTIIVTPTYDYEHIKKELQRVFGNNMNIVSLEYILENKYDYV